MLSQENNKRSTDGLTLTKISAWTIGFLLTTLIGLLTWIGKDVKDTVETIKVNQVIAMEHQKNTDARVERIAKTEEEHIKDFNAFKVVAYSWYNENEKATRNRR